jgi:hypothetical protein
LTATGRAAPATAGAATAGHADNAIYYLDGQNSELRDHVGHLVEITGRLAAGSTPGVEHGTTGDTTPEDPSAAVATGRTGTTNAGVNTSGLLAGGATATADSSARPTAGAAPAASSPEAMVGARLEVQFVHMIAPSCSFR